MAAAEQALIGVAIAFAQVLDLRRDARIAPPYVGAIHVAIRLAAVDIAGAEQRQGALHPQAIAHLEPRVIHPLVQGLAALGAYGICVPEEFGGANLDYVTLALVLEEIAAGDGGTSTANSTYQGGYAQGTLTGYSVAKDGIVKGNYSNGQTKNLAQIVLANFTNPNGLMSVGNNAWIETASSGQPKVGTPDTGTLGVLQSGAVEESNVDLTGELVNMIVQQRNYQANAQSIKTQDQIMQTLVNIR